MYLQIPIGNMPINLVLFSENRTVAFVKVANFEALLDQPEDGTYVGAFFYPEGFSLFRSEAESEDFDYNVRYPYYQMPLMKGWLMQQNLQLPAEIMFV
jgi:hypothetical protein